MTERRAAIEKLLKDLTKKRFKRKDKKLEDKPHKLAKSVAPVVEALRDQVQQQINKLPPPVGGGG